MSFDWYHRVGVDPWQLSACEPHGAELVALRFQRGPCPLPATDITGAAHQCALCNGSTSFDQVRVCRCYQLGIPCPVHRPKPTGAAGEWSRVRCTRCGAALQLPADRIAFEQDSVPQFDARRIACGPMERAAQLVSVAVAPSPSGDVDRYPLEYVAGPGALDELDVDEVSTMTTLTTLTTTNRSIEPAARLRCAVVRTIMPLPQ